MLKDVIVQKLSGGNNGVQEVFILPGCSLFNYHTLVRS
jgi:hypothetical protein